MYSNDLPTMIAASCCFFAAICCEQRSKLLFKLTAKLVQCFISGSQTFVYIVRLKVKTIAATRIPKIC